MSTTDEKIDKLTETVEELARMTAQGFTEIRGDLATKEDLKELRSEIKEDMDMLKGNVQIMLDKHIGVVRKDYESIASRMKIVEEEVLTK